MAFDSIAAPSVRVTIPIQDRERLRRRIECAVEKLIAALDALDGDVDLEQQCEDEGAVTGDEEPWLNPPTGNGSYDFHDCEINAVPVEVWA